MAAGGSVTTQLAIAVDTTCRTQPGMLDMTGIDTSDTRLAMVRPALNYCVGGWPEAMDAAAESAIQIGLVAFRRNEAGGIRTRT